MALPGGKWEEHDLSLKETAYAKMRGNWYL
jgi:hypothetical protein